MGSEIGRKDKLKLASDRLSLLDVNQIPSNLDTSRVQPIYEIDPQYMGPVIGAETVDYNGGNTVDFSGLTSFDFEIFAATPANIMSRFNSLAIKVDVPTDAAPSEVQIFAYYQLPVGQPFRIIDFKPAFSTAGALVQWRYAMGGSFIVVSGTSCAWHGYVTPLVPIRLSMIKSSGGTFPAGTTLEWSRFVSQWEVGTLPPWG